MLAFVLQSAPPTRHGYVKQFDALRGIAVFGVIVTHYAGSVVPTVAHSRLFPMIGLPGFIGVRLFFVLSGYLITRILLAAKTAAAPFAVARSFYARRFLRIFPLYYAVVAFACATSVSIRHCAPWLFTYTQNIKFAIDGAYPVVAHLWSLAVEEQFYLVWPWVVLFLSASSLQRALLALLVAAPLARALLFIHSANEVSIHVLPIACVDTLAAGALAALAQTQGRRLSLSAVTRAIVVVTIGGLGMASFFPSTTWTWHVFGETALAVCFADLIGRIGRTGR